MAKDKGVVEAEIEETGENLTGLIAVELDGETIHVNPATLTEHLNLGWRIAR